MRYVFTTGTVTPTDMPDHDARDSFFENVILSGNFTGYDFRNVSFSRCLVVGGGAGARPRGEPLEIRSRIDLLRDPRLTGEDRRGIELVLEADASGHRVHLYTLHPWPMGVAALVTGTPHWNWWD